MRPLLCAVLLVSGCYGHARSTRVGAEDQPALAPLVEVPAGSFTMGDDNGEPAEYPERAVGISAFAIERTEVTNDAYARCVAAGVCDAGPYRNDPELGGPLRPVVGVSWHDAVAYCGWAGRRLPTEAEWEYAAKGSQGRRFWPWTGAFVVDRANSRGGADGYAKTAPVGSFPAGASVFGVLDMAGNAAEWVNDHFDPILYQREPRARDPKGPEGGRERVVRGGSWLDGPHLLRVASRVGKAPTEVDEATGFRCAADR